jgi:hypothetical protein
MNVTRAVLPVMRKQRSGLLLTIFDRGHRRPDVLLGMRPRSSASKGGWSLHAGDRPSASARCWSSPVSSTEPLTNDSTTYAQPSIGDYAERTKETSPRGAAWTQADGRPRRLPTPP